MNVDGVNQTPNRQRCCCCCCEMGPRFRAVFTAQTALPSALILHPSMIGLVNSFIRGVIFFNTLSGKLEQCLAGLTCAQIFTKSKLCPTAQKVKTTSAHKRRHKLANMAPAPGGFLPGGLLPHGGGSARLSKCVNNVFFQVIIVPWNIGQL